MSRAEREPPLHLIGSLASIDAQRDWIGGGWRDEYLLAEDVLNDAFHFCEQARRPETWNALTPIQRNAIARLEQVLEAADVERYTRLNIADLVENDLHWIAAREQAKETLRAFEAA